MATVCVDVSVVVGSKPDLVFACLDSFLGSTSQDDCAFKIVVVVNDGNERVREKIASRYPDVRVIVNAVPLGFASNHNMALADGNAPYVLMLNDDLVFRQGSVAPLLEFMLREENRLVGAVSPRLLNPDLTLQPSTYSFPSLMHSMAVCTGLRRRLPRGIESAIVRTVFRKTGSSRHWLHDRECDVDTFRGACVLYRRAALQQVDWLDECTLVGGEETELHMRLSKDGWRVVFSPCAEVIHIGKQSVGSSPYLEVEFVKGHLNICRRHRSRIAFEILRLASMVRYGAVFIDGVVGGKPGTRKLGSYGFIEMRSYGHNSRLWRERACARWLDR